MLCYEKFNILIYLFYFETNLSLLGISMKEGLTSNLN